MFLVLVCIVAGAAVAGAGAWLIRTSEVGAGDTSFVRAWSPRALRSAGGWVALFVGLFLVMIVAPMLYLSRGQ